MPTATKPTVLAALRRVLLSTTAIDAIAIGASIINPSRHPILIPGTTPTGGN